jgi:hypothetical protein
MAQNLLHADFSNSASNEACDCTEHVTLLGSLFVNFNFIEFAFPWKYLGTMVVITESKVA